MPRSEGRGFNRGFAAALALLVVPAASHAAGAGPVSEAVDAAMAAGGVGAATAPGCAINVARAGQVLLVKGYGSADLEHRIAFGPETVSESGSVAKQFTAAAIFMLVEEGKLSLDDDIRKYLPEMPDYGAKIRIRDLIQQTSGIREWSTLASLRGYPRAYRKAYTNADILKLEASQSALNFAPGEKFEYSNGNYGLLTIIIDRVSGMSAAAFGKARIFGPLGMSATQWRDDARRIVPNRATAYRATATGYEQAMPFEDVYGHGALLTTVNDLQLWNRALLNGGLSPYVTRQMLTPATLSSGATRGYGGGVFLADYRGHRAYRHGGQTAGYTAQLWALPDDGVSIALLCNLRPGDTGEIAARAADAVLGLQPLPRAPAAEKLAKAPEGLPAYFKSAEGEMLALITDRGRAYVNLFTGDGFTPLVGSPSARRLTTRNAFGVQDVSFEGKDRIVVTPEAREPLVFMRIPAAKPPEAEIAGLYVSSDLKTAYRVERRGANYRLAIADRDVDYPIRFELKWLNGDTFLAHLDADSAMFRNDLIATFAPATAPGRATMRLSAVMALQGIDGLEFTREP